MPATFVYWGTTALIALAYLVGGLVDIVQNDELRQVAAKLGYPLYFFVILGVWKVGAALTLLAPRLPRLKEWAYAGMLINLTSASISHVVSHDPPGEAITPLVMLVLAGASWATRPAERRLAGPWL